ncbi:unnamed protein product [Rotaria sordida]|uniref:Uncharacterized protein n=1 Tax=Rotaria sordida TaxID=392033 RepID=A0A819XPN1_9BILA|nr:unnamed protein product [Rotaria sordida]
MSDKIIPRYLCNIDDTATDREQYQQQQHTRKLTKAEENFQLRQQYPQFVVPPSMYKVIHVNKYTSMEEFDLLINHVQECTQFTIDTESEKSNGQLALIQIQTIPSQLPLLIILIELQHLPSNKLPTSGNKLYSWGDMKKELEPMQDYHLLNWPTTASLINIQLYFPDWYEWALAHCESCRPNHHQQHPDVINYDNVTTQNYSSSRCICHERNPYHSGEKWSLQKALIYAAHMFIDKSSTVNNWAAGLTSNNSTLSYGRRKKMINYAIYDCFSTTYLIRPVLEYWTFKQLNNINIVELFTSFKALPLPKINSSNKKSKKIKKNINLQHLFNMNDDDLQPISDDEIYLNQLIAPVTNEQLEKEKISNYEQKFTGQNLVSDAELISNEDDKIIIDNNQEGQPAEENDNDETPPATAIEEKLPTTKRNRTHHQRSMASRQQRNKKRNNTHRMRRYQHHITRSIYYKFKEPLVKKILKQHDVNYVHVKVVDGTLFIGVKTNMLKEKYQDQIPEDLFDRKHHQYYYQHHHQNHHQYHHQYNHRHRHQHHHE